MDLYDVRGVAEEDVVAPYGGGAVQGVVSLEEVEVDDARRAGSSLVAVESWVVDVCDGSPCHWVVFEEGDDVVCDLVDGVVEVEEASSVRVV